MTTKAVLYAAKSTVDKRGSIPTQLEDVRTKAAELELTVIAEFFDEDESGYHQDRGPKLAAALDLAETEQAAIVVQHTDRLCRGDGVKARHLAELYFWSQKAGVPIRSVEDDSTFENPVMAVVMGERNHQDSKRKAASVTAGMRRRFEKGLTNGGRRPYGYDLIDTPETNSVLTVNQAEATIVKRIFAEADAGRSNMAIARTLDAENIPTQRGGYWRASTVQNILKNPVYIGQVAFQKETGPGIHQPIIHQDLWDRVKVLRDSRRKGTGKGRGRPTSGTHLFTRGFLRCSCGDAMAPRTQRNRREPDREIYFCLRHWHFPDQCTQQPIERSTIDLAVYSYFEQLGLDIEATREALSFEGHRKTAEVDALLAQATTEVSKTADRLARVRRDYTDGQITAADWHSLRTELEAEQAAAQAQADQLTAQRDELAQSTAAIDAETQLVQRLAGIRATIAGKINGAQDLDAVRAALRQTFQGFRLTTRAANPTPVDLAWVGDDRLEIEPIVREDAIEGLSEHGLAILTRAPLAAETIDTKESPHVICFEPIPIGGTA